MDEKSIKGVGELVKEVAEDKDIGIEKLVVFGSRARDDFREESDIDLLIVSQDFENTAWNKRPKPFYKNWNYDKMPIPEFICLTPEEFEERKHKDPHIVRTAVEEGVSIA